MALVSEPVRLRTLCEVKVRYVPGHVSISFPLMALLTGVVGLRSSQSNTTASNRVCLLCIFDLNALLAHTPSHVKASVSYEDNHVSIWRYYPSLDTIIGPSPRFSLLLSSHNTSHNPFFDGSSCAYSSRRDELIVTTNLLKPRDPAQMPVILICRIKLQRDGEGSIQKVDWSKLRPPSMMAMPAGAVVHGDDESILYCSQGNFEQGAWPPDKFVEGSGGLFRMGQGGRQPPEPIVTSFFGTEFGCVSSVAIERSGEREALWFVDAGRRGFESGFRHRPRLPAAVWRYVPSTGDLRAMTDDLKRPWSIALAPNGETVYVTNCDPGDDESALEDNM